jgi:predicted nucleic acid-binding protein
MLFCRENVSLGLLLTMEVLYQLSYVGVGGNRSRFPGISGWARTVLIQLEIHAAQSLLSSSSSDRCLCWWGEGASVARSRASGVLVPADERDRLNHLDASALVKLIHEEPESESLRTFLDADELISSELVLTEIPRAIRRAATAHPALPVAQLIERTQNLLEAIALLPVDRALLAAAGAIAEPTLRSLDAIHLASAIDATPLDGLVSYDVGQSAAARLAGLRTMAPAQPPSRSRR